MKLIPPGFRICLFVVVFALCNSPARAATGSIAFDEAMQAVRAKDCTRLTALVKDGVERQIPGLLYVAGLMRDEALCVERDPDRAFQFYSAGGKRGDRDSALAIGLRYALGDGLRRSYARAASWLTHADALELGLLEGRSLDWPSRVKYDALKRRGLERFGTFVPILPEDDPTAPWMGYVLTVHALASQALHGKARSLAAKGFQGVYLIDVCPTSEVIQATRVKQPNGAMTPSAESVATERTAREVIERTYQGTQQALPRPMTAPHASARCIQKAVAVGFR